VANCLGEGGKIGLPETVLVVSTASAAGPERLRKGKSCGGMVSKGVDFVMLLCLTLQYIN